MSRPMATLGATFTVSFFQKYILKSPLTFVYHNTICSDSQYQIKMSQFLLIWSTQLFEIFLIAPCQSNGLQYFLKIKVTTISADNFLTFFPYRLMFSVSRAECTA